jgi:hypothetical protein
MELSPLRSSGLLTIIAGILFGSFMFLHPANTPQGAVEPIWVPVHFAWFFSYLLLTCSFLPLYSPLTGASNFFLTLSYWLSFIGTLLSLPIAVWDAFVIPYLAKHAPDFIAQIEEISTETPVLVFRIIVFLTVFLFSFGYLFYGITLAKIGILPKLAAISLAIGAPLFWIGAFFFSKGAMGNLVTEIGSFLFGVGLVIFGVNLWSKPISLPFKSDSQILNS